MMVILALRDANSAAPIDEFSDPAAALARALSAQGEPCTLLRGSAAELLAAWPGIEPAARIIIDLRLLGDFADHQAALLARGAVAIVLHEQAMGPDDAPIDPRGCALLGQLCHVVASSASVAEALAERCGLARAGVLVLPPGTNSASRVNHQSSSGCAILSIGPLVPASGHDVLLRALDRLFDLDWSLTLAGGAGDDARHAARVREMAQGGQCAGRVRFIDARDTEALATAWQGSDIFALAARWSATDAAARAALRRGVPVAMCAGGAAAAVVTLACGVIVAPGEADLFSKALRRMIFDRALRAAMAQAAWDLGEKLPDWPTQARALLRMLAT